MHCVKCQSQDFSILVIDQNDMKIGGGINVIKTDSRI